MKDVILSLWDRIVYYREHKVANRIELVAKALPVLDRIADLEKSEKLGREQAELLRRQITGGCVNFIESGAMIPEIAKAATVEPRLLLAPEAKLLVGPDTVQCDSSETAARDTSPESLGDLENLSRRERSTLDRLLRKAKKSGNDPTGGAAV